MGAGPYSSSPTHTPPRTPGKASKPGKHDEDALESLGRVLQMAGKGVAGICEGGEDAGENATQSVRGRYPRMRSTSFGERLAALHTYTDGECRRLEAYLAALCRRYWCMCGGIGVCVSVSAPLPESVCMPVFVGGEIHLYTNQYRPAAPRERYICTHICT